MRLRAFFQIFSSYSGIFLLCWWFMAFVITHMPVSDTVSNTPYIDKVTHIILYTGLSLFFLLWKKPSYIFNTVFILVTYAIFDEVSQGFVQRTPDIQDFLIDLAGISMGSILFLLTTKKQRPV